jgi:hypothetical protein
LQKAVDKVGSSAAAVRKALGLQAPKSELTPAAIIRGRADTFSLGPSGHP